MIDPQAKAVLDDLARRKAAQSAPADGREALAKAREMTNGLADFGAPKVDLASVEDLDCPGRGGPVPVRLYRPSDRRPLPLLVWFHAGGAIAGSIEVHDEPCRALAAESGWALASVGYRLAPEHPFPAALDDCRDAVAALVDRAAALGPDAGRLAVGGDSIGGLFAARVAILARGGGGPAIAGTLHLYPNTDLTPDRAFASLETEEGNVMTRDSLAYENDLFVPDRAARATPAVSPLLEPDLSGLPPALVVTCERDPLRDEGEAYAERLSRAGVTVTHVAFPGMIHGFLQMGGRIDATARLRAEVSAFLRALAG